MALDAARKHGAQRRMMATPQGQAGPRPAFALMFAALLIVGVGNSMLFPLLPPLARALSVPDSAVGWIYALSALIWVFASPFWGRLSDRVGRRPVAAAGLGAYAVSMAAFAGVAQLGLAFHLPWLWVFVGLLLSRAIFGLVGSATSPAAQAYVADVTAPAQRREALSRLTAAFALGATLGPPLGAALALVSGLVAPLAIIAALAAIGAALLWFRLPEAAPPQPDRPRGEGAGVFTLARDSRVAGYLIYALGQSIVLGTLAQTFGFYTMDTLGLSGEAGVQQAALGFMAGALAALLTQLVIVPRLSWTQRQMMLIGVGLAILGIGVQLVAGGLALLIASQLVQGVGMALGRTGATSGASLAVRGNEQGGVAGLIVATNGAGFVISPLTGPALYDLAGRHAPLWAAIAVLALMGAFAFFSRRLRRGPDAASPPGA